MRKSPGKVVRKLPLPLHGARYLLYVVIQSLPLVGLFCSDDESLEGLWQELDDCKNDQVRCHLLLELHL
jgi:hypothetical protein